MASQSIGEYYRLAKPGIVYGNILTTAAAFLYASRFHFTFELFLATIVGMALVIGSACVFNNYLDREIDKKMARTATRALATGAISVRAALTYGTILGILGLALLYLYVNLLTTLLALFGGLAYVFLYGYAKRASDWSTIIGSISGAMPIVAGYTAVANQLDTPALILFLILVLWQMPHFYAIAIYRREDYLAAGIPVLSITKGVARAKRSILAYIFAFALVATSLSFLGYAGYVYRVVMIIVSILWLIRASRAPKADDDALWARSVFFFSLIVLLVFSLVLALAPLLP